MPSLEILAGFLIAAAIGATGVGGGVLTAPVLILFFELPPPRAVGTALLFTTAVKLNAVIGYLVRRQVDWRALGWLAAGGVPGALLASLTIVRWTPAQNARLISAVVGGIIALTVAYNLIRRRSATNAKRFEMHRRLPWFAFGIGVEVGYSSAGAGALGSVLLLRYTQLAPVAIVGTDLMFGLILSATGGGAHFAVGEFDLPVLIRMGVGGLAGAQVGSLCSSRLPSKALQNAILIWAFLMGVLLFVRGIS